MFVGQLLPEVSLTLTVVGIERRLRHRGLAKAAACSTVTVKSHSARKEAHIPRSDLV